MGWELSEKTLKGKNLSLTVSNKCTYKSPQMMLNWKEHKQLYFLLGIVFLACFFTFNIPFAGDVLYRSNIASYIFENDFSSIIDVKADNGTPPLYSLALAAWWTIIGKTLSASHLLFSFFILTSLYQLYLFALRNSKKEIALLATALVIFDPTFSMQAIVMGYDLLFVMLFLICLNSIYKKHLLIFALASIAIALLHMRGFVIVMSIYLIEILLLTHTKSFLIILQKTIKYIPSALALALWLIYHHSIQTWYIVSPENHGYHSTTGLWWTLKNLLLQLTTFMSNGRIIPIGIIALGLLFYMIKRYTKQTSKLLKMAWFTILSVIPLWIIFSAFQYPTGSRYYMIAYPFLYISVAYLLYQITNLKIRTTLTSVFILALFGSNFIVNPHPYANGWDTSLKGVAQYALQDNALEYLNKEKIQANKVYAAFPLNQNFKGAYLDQNLNYSFRSIEEWDSLQMGYIIHSNIYNRIEESLPHNPPPNMEIIYREQKLGLWIEIYKTLDI